MEIVNVFCKFFQKKLNGVRKFLKKSLSFSDNG